MPTDPGPTQWDLPIPPADADDVIAVGADLAPATLLAAYRRGLFPMPYDPVDPVTRSAGDLISWWSPVDRGVLPLDALTVSKSLRRSLRRYEVTCDTAFAEVVAGCGDPGRDGGWISSDIAAAYQRLFELGWAHSVEVWADGALVGGLYGVALGGLFAGESMFSRAVDASKVALVHLVQLLGDEHAGDRLIDTQWQTDHLATLGVQMIDRADYLARLPALLAVPTPRAFERSAG
ncbi:MAG TPA: leucyl/phenylalanyl-tRNA--protein transferase [Marmoricola sp.]|jgi:leucyl/phenylalanyl-tRNA--protein transferase|nr:leucyl/phenylalanyl-tRNA--protein transferase [Marmoricola sp.]